MKPATYNIEVYQGDTLILPMRVRTLDAEGVPGDYEDLTGWTPKAQVRNKSSDALVQELTAAIDPDQVANKGKLTVSATAAQTALWDVLAMVWDLQLTNGSAQVRTILAGSVTVTKDVTE
jgi:hypothetical protein